MKILLLGANGQVGWELRRVLAPLGTLTTSARSGPSDRPLDASDLAAVSGLLDELRPELIVNAAAYTAVDRAESEPDLAQRLNAELPALLGRWAAERGALVTHYSTDYVFDGTRDRPYVESDTPNPLSVYGRSKLAGDEAVQASGCDHLILRVSWAYGTRGRNFLLTMRRLMVERDQLGIVDDQVGAPTWCRRIAETTALALGRILDSAESRKTRAGLYHFAPSGETSWFGFASAIRDAGGFDCELTPISTAGYPTPAARPANSRLDTGRLQSAFDIIPPDWRHDFADCLAGIDRETTRGGSYDHPA